MVSEKRDSIARGSADKSVRRVELLLCFFEIDLWNHVLQVYVYHESDFCEREKRINV